MSKLEASELKISALTADIGVLTECKNQSEEELESREDINKRLCEANNQLKDKLARYCVVFHRSIVKGYNDLN